MMKPETREEKIARLSSRRYTKAQLARLVTDGDGALARAQRQVEMLQTLAPGSGVVVDATRGRFRVTVRHNGENLVVVVSPHRATAQAVAAGALDGNTPTALAALTALAETGDTDATYTLPNYCANLDLTGPWAKEDRRELAKRERLSAQATECLESATYEEYPSTWAAAVISARRANRPEPRLQPRYALRKVGAENDVA